ncbi:MAG: hypothetical protein AAFU41_10740 [Pseudomonadota bacterium]
MDDLKDPNENAWYILSTLYGELSADMDDDEARELNKRNADAWNVWVRRHLSSEAVAQYEALTDLTLNDPTPRFWTEFHNQVAIRSIGMGLEIPETFERVNLSSLHFTRPVSFANRFFPSVTFANSCFEENVEFGRSVFSKTAEFSRATFKKDAFFIRSHFAGDALFRGRLPGEDPKKTPLPAAFGPRTFFSGARFAQRADFFCRRFGPDDGKVTDISFANAVFDGPLSFEEAPFTDLMPVLTNTTFPNASKVTASADYWPKLRPSPVGRLIRYIQNGPETYTTQKPETVKASAATLRHAMSRQMLPEEEHFFFRREMWGAARSGPLMARPLIWLFGAVSNYGHSVGRPSLCLGALWLAGFATFSNQSYGDNLILGSWEAAFFSFANMFKFFGLLDTYFDGVAGGFPERIQVLAGAQTVLAFILLFFLGLGLRTRFRLR